MSCGMDPNDRDSPTFKKTFRDAIYEQMFDIAKSQVIETVLVGPFSKEIQNPDWPSHLKGLSFLLFL